MRELVDIRPEAIADPVARAAVVALLNLVEQSQAEVRSLRAELQRLNDEIARLKGEQGRPNVPPNRPAAGSSELPADRSSEKERRNPAVSKPPRQKRPKVSRLRFDRTQTLSVDPLRLPPDAIFKGCTEHHVQDLILRTDNVLFRREKWYSPSTRRTYLAPLPEGYEGEFGPGIQSLALSLCYGALVSHAGIARLFADAGTLISAGQVARLLTEGQERFHQERRETVVAGLSASPWQHLDATPTRVDGKNAVCHVLSHPLFSAYHTTPTGDRLAVLEALQTGLAPSFRLGPVALAYLETVGLSQKQRQRLRVLPQQRCWDRTEFEALLDGCLPTLGVQQRRWVLEAAAVAGYHAQGVVPIVDTLLCDDAPVYRSLTRQLCLCWVHDGRHYQKLSPWILAHQEQLAEFRGRYWDFYRELLAYREAPSPAEAQRLERAFDDLFATRTGYFALDERIEKTQAKKAALLLVLRHPELSLHNNPAELAARRRVRKRDVSFGPRSEAGAAAWDTFQSLAATCAKLGVSFHHYLHDRITRAARIPRLADLITEAARSLDLGRSWADSPSPCH